jgi:hypothetical protein
MWEAYFSHNGRNTFSKNFPPLLFFFHIFKNKKNLLGRIEKPKGETDVKLKVSGEERVRQRDIRKDGGNKVERLKY